MREILQLDEAIGARAADLGRSMLDIFHRQQQLVRMAPLDAAELATVVGEDGADLYAECFIEWQDAIVEQIGGGHRHLRGVHLREGQRAEHIDDDLHVELANALERASVERVLIQPFSGPGGFHVLAAELDRVPLQQPDLGIAEHDGIALCMLLKTHQALVARFDAMP